MKVGKCNARYQAQECGTFLAVVEGGEVTLSGHVPERRQKRLAEDLALGVRGVREVHNHLRVK